MPYPNLRPRKRKKKPRGRPTKDGSLLSCNQPSLGMLFVTAPNGSTSLNSYRPQRLRWVQAAGMNPGNFKDPTAWSYDCIEQTQWSGQFTSKPSGGGTSLWNGSLSINSNFSEESVVAIGSWDGYRAELYNRALTRLNEKIRGSLDLALALAEAGATARMLHSLANFRNFVHGIRSGNVNPFGGGSADLANGWLQFQYGWRPLMGDIFSAADESLRVIINEIAEVSASASQPIGGVRLQRTAPSINGPNWPNVPYERLIDSGRQSCRISVRYDVGAAFDISRWTSMNPVSIAWEIIPYSFVVDWFVDISSYIRNFETALLYSNRFRGGYMSECYGYDATGIIKSGYSRLDVPSGVTYGITSGTSKVRRRTFARTVLSSHPLPRLPSFKAKLGWQRYLSAAALVTQLFAHK